MENVLFIRQLLLGTVIFTGGCATVTAPPAQVEANLTKAQQLSAQHQEAVPIKKGLKRKIAIGRFSNETRYGRTFQTDANLDPLGKQASDILTSRLVDSQQFIVLERSDLNKVLDEQKIGKATGVVGADTLIIGAVTEFGRSTTGTSGFLSGTKIQTATAKVEIRLVDITTGQAFFSTSGTGTANTESGTVAGFGSRADYDGTLNDKAISAAISDLLGRLVSKLEDRPWQTNILKVDGGQVIIAAGAHQGLKVGDQLKAYKAGEKIRNPQTGFVIDLPPLEIGKLQIRKLFGDTETNEGAICDLVSGDLGGIKAASVSGVFVRQN
jgi:curli biogenesis system outer membrane secretion channel CsgG